MGQYDIFGNELSSAGSIKADVAIIMQGNIDKTHSLVMVEYMHMRYPKLAKALTGSADPEYLDSMVALMEESPTVERACRDYRQTKSLASVISSDR